MFGWYVLQTKPNSEENVKTLLSKAGYEMFLPKISSVKKGTVSLFPMYVFVRTDLSNTNDFRMVKYTRGVNKILGANNSTAYPISDEIVNIIKSRLNEKEVLEFNHFTEGKLVRINNGPFKDLEGVLEKPMSANGRVAVLLSVYGKSVRMQMNVKDLKVA